MNQRLLGAVALVAVAGGIYWFRCRGSDEKPAADAGAKRPSFADKLKSRPMRTRWAAPVCKPTGIVKLPDGSPAGDAIVMLQAAPLSHHVSAEPIDEPDVQTGVDGKFQLQAVAAGQWTLVAALPRHRAVTKSLTISGAGDCGGLELTLGPPGQPVTGTVTDVSGGPIRGALVVARVAASLPGSPLALATTRPDGRYEFAIDVGDYSIEVKHPQYVLFEGQIAVRGPSTFDAVLTPGGELRGIVLTRDRREPVPGARVTVRGGRASGAMGGLVREVVSGDDGKFTVTGLGSGRAFVAAVGPAHASRDPVEIALGIAETRDDVEVLVDPARRIRGVVIHEGKPSAEAIVTAYLGGGAVSDDVRMEMVGAGGEAGELAAETDADGVFELWGLAPGIYEVSAMGPHALPAPSVTADTTRGDVDALELELGHGVVIRGRVEPPQVATVSLSGMAMLEASERWASQSEVKTDAAGTFTLHGAEPGELTVYAHSSEGFVGEKVVTVGPQGADGVVIPLAKQGVTIAGRVTDTRGQPVVGVYVGAWGVVTTGDGSFKVPSAEPGQHELVVTDAEDTYEIIAPKVTTLEVPATGIADLAITVVSRDRTLRGVVIAADGKPARDAWVVAIPSNEWADGNEPPDLSSTNFDWTGRKNIALTNADGQFAIAGVKAGNYDVAAEGDRGNARGITRKVSPDHAVRVQLTTLAGLSITVTRDGKPVPRYELEVTGPEPDQRTVSSADGRITLRGLPPGEYSIRAVADDGAARATVMVQQGGTANTTLALGQLASVTGQIVNKADGKPVPGVYVYVADALPDPSPDATWLTDETGRFTVTRVPAGKSMVQVWGAAAPIEVAFTATDGQRVDVGTIQIEPAPLEPIGSPVDPGMDDLPDDLPEP